MSDTVQRRSGHPSLGSWAGFAATFVVGGTGGLLFVAFALSKETPDAGPKETLLGYSMVIAIVVIPLLIGGGRYGRSFAAGAALACIAAWVWTLSSVGDGGMSEKEIAREMATIRAAGTPAYYVGDEAEGHDLRWVSTDNDYTNGPGFSFEYGFHCEDEGCTSDVSVNTIRIGRDGADSDDWAPSGCRHLAPVLGVPTATSDYSLLLLTGDVVVALRDPHTDDDYRGERKLAADLRRVGEIEPLKVLPWPSRHLLAWAKERC